MDVFCVLVVVLVGSLGAVDGCGLVAQVLYHIGFDLDASLGGCAGRVIGAPPPACCKACSAK